MKLRKIYLYTPCVSQWSQCFDCDFDGCSRYIVQISCEFLQLILPIVGPFHRISSRPPIIQVYLPVLKISLILRLLSCWLPCRCIFSSLVFSSESWTIVEFTGQYFGQIKQLLDKWGRKQLLAPQKICPAYGKMRLFWVFFSKFHWILPHFCWFLPNLSHFVTFEK